MQFLISAAAWEHVNRPRRVCSLHPAALQSGIIQRAAAGQRAQKAGYLDGDRGSCLCVPSPGNPPVELQTKDHKDFTNSEKALLGSFLG